MLLLDGAVDFVRMLLWVVRLLGLVDFVRRISMGAILWRGQRLDFEDVPEAFERDLQLEVGEDHVGVVLEVVERGHGLQFGIFVAVGEVSAEDCSNCIFAG